MNKCELNELLDKIVKLEKMLMRDLDEREIDYLMNHTINEFLNNVLGFNQEDLIVLSKLRKAISDWCTRPEGAFDMDDIDWNIFNDDLYTECSNDVNIFKKDPLSTGRGVVDVLSTIVRELQEELDRYEMDMAKIEEIKTKKREPELFDILEDEPDIPVPAELTPELVEKIIKAGMEMLEKEGKSKMVVPKGYKDSMGEGFELDGEYDAPIETYPSIFAEITWPDEINKWAKYYSVGDHWFLNHELILISEEIFKKQYKCFNAYDDFLNNFNSDEYIGEVVDQVKDVILTNIIRQLENDSKTIEFEDEDIQMEVLDYLYKNNYRVKSIENKVSLL